MVSAAFLIATIIIVGIGIIVAVMTKIAEADARREALKAEEAALQRRAYEDYWDLQDQIADREHARWVRREQRRKQAELKARLLENKKRREAEKLRREQMRWRT